MTFTHLAVKLYNCFPEMKIVQNASSEELLVVAGEWRDKRTRHSTSTVRRVRSLVCPFRWPCCSILDGNFASHRAFCVAADSVRKLMQDCPPCLRQVPVSETLRRAGPKNITSYSTSAELEVGSDCGLLCALRLGLGECTVVGRRRRWLPQPTSRLLIFGALLDFVAPLLVRRTDQIHPDR